MSQMGSMSTDWLRALNGSFTPWCRVDVWRDGSLVAQDIEVVSGTVNADLSIAQPGSVSLTVADPTGTLALTTTSPLSSYGSRLNVLVGIDFPTGPQWLSVGWFEITEVDPDEQFTMYKRPGESAKVTVRRGGQVQVTAQDRSQTIMESRALTRQQPTESTVLTEIAYLLQDVVPWAGSTLTDQSVPKITYADDRLAAIVSLANVLDADPVCDQNGSVALIPRAWGSSVWDVAGGDAGVMASYRRKMTRTGVYNGVIERGQDPVTQAVIQGFAAVTSGTLKWDGVLKRIPFFEASPLLTTQAAVNAAAVTTLNRVVRRRTSTLTVQCAPNPGLQLGDVITLEMPRGPLPVRISASTLPLPLGAMTLTVQADPDALDQVT